MALGESQFQRFTYKMTADHGSRLMATFPSLSSHRPYLILDEMLAMVKATE